MRTFSGVAGGAAGAAEGTGLFETELPRLPCIPRPPCHASPGVRDSANPEAIPAGSAASEFKIKVIHDELRESSRRIQQSSGLRRAVLMRKPLLDLTLPDLFRRPSSVRSFINQAYNYGFYDLASPHSQF